MMEMAAKRSKGDNNAQRNEQNETVARQSTQKEPHRFRRLPDRHFPAANGRRLIAGAKPSPTRRLYKAAAAMPSRAKQHHLRALPAHLPIGRSPFPHIHS